MGKSIFLSGIVGFSGRTVTWVKCRVAAESCPTPAVRRSWGIMWVEKEVFYEQTQHRGREEEPPGKVGTACLRGGGSCPHGGTLLKGPPAGTSKAGIQCVFIFSGFPIGGGPNDSWPRCAFLLAFSDFGPKGHRGPRVLQRGQKRQVQEKRQNQGSTELSVCVYSA